MDLEPNELQLELVDTVRRLCADRHPMSAVRAHLDGASVNATGWRALTDAGVFSLTTPEERGGVGLGWADAALVYQELGRWLVPGPLVATHLAFSVGITPPAEVVSLIEVPTVEHGPLLVEHLDAIDRLLVLRDDRVEVVDPVALVATSLDRPLDAHTPMARVRSVPSGEVVGDAARAASLRLHGAMLTASLQIGIAGAVTALAVDYALGREQFGRPIGSFQAIKHLLADMHARAEVARAMVDTAAVLLDQSPSTAWSAVAAAKALAGEAALANAKSAIQVHGGMGFTWEVDAQLFLKRAWVLDTHFGSPDVHAESLAAAL